MNRTSRREALSMLASLALAAATWAAPAAAQPFDNALPAAALAFDNAAVTDPTPVPPKMDPRFRAAVAAKRFALVIGNAEYTESIGALKNAPKDAALVAAKLKKMGFEVKPLENVTHKQLTDEIKDLLEKRIHTARGRNVPPPLVVIYFAGHGFHEANQGFITGVDIDSDRPLEKSLSVRKISEDLFNYATVVLLLDTCRTEAPKPQEAKAFDNGTATVPAAIVDPATDISLIKSKLKLGVGGDRGSVISVDQGHARSVHNVLHSYAVFQAGKTAQSYYSATSVNSPYAEGLGMEFGEGEELKVELLFVRDFIDRVTKQAHETNSEGQLGSIYMKRTLKTDDQMRQDWDEVMDNLNPSRIQKYITKYPESPYRAAAELLRSRYESGSN